MGYTARQGAFMPINSHNCKTIFWVPRKALPFGTVHNNVHCFIIGFAVTSWGKVGSLVWTEEEKLHGQ